MEVYDWKAHYAPILTECGKASVFRQYHLENNSGKGTVRACLALQGVQTHHTDLYVDHCSKPVPLSDSVVEINYCKEGRYECSVSDRYCFYVGHGDLSVGMAGRLESHGGFPTQRFHGLSVFLELETFARREAKILRELEIDLDKIHALAIQKPRYFVLHGNAEACRLGQALIDAEAQECLPLLRLRLLGLLVFLSGLNPTERSGETEYISRKNVLLAKEIHRRITADLTRHLTIAELSQELHAAPTAMKNVFKSVFGTSIYAYQKSLRLQEAQRLLRETDIPVAGIAAKAGYTNPGKFAAAFRNMFGLTPCAYRVSLLEP